MTARAACFVQTDPIEDWREVETRKLLSSLVGITSGDFDQTTDAILLHADMPALFASDACIGAMLITLGVDGSVIAEARRIRRPNTAIVAVIVGSDSRGFFLSIAFEEMRPLGRQGAA